MAPDLNSLFSAKPQAQPRNMTSTASPSSTTSLARPATHSLAAAATLNATDRRPSSGQNSPLLDRRTSERRRSQVLMNLSLNDPSLPAPGELADVRRRSSSGRNASLGDIHNEMEQEQEAQVNRMLSLIRGQQEELEALRTQQVGGSQPQNNSAVEESTPQSERSFSFPSVHPAVGQVPRPTGRLSRENSIPIRSPALRPLPSQEFHEQWPPSPSSQARRSSSSRRNSIRDETAFYQAEHANLQRENQMLKLRVRELEKQLHDRQSSAPGAPTHHSNLSTSPTIKAHGNT